MRIAARRGQHSAVAAVFSLITLFQTWPLARHLSSVLPNDLGDPVLNTWILWWNAQAVPLTSGWWDAPMFYPARGVTAFSETLLGLSLVASPLQWMGVSPVAAYNILFLLSFPLSAFTAYLLSWSLTRRVGPSMIAGAVYGYAIFRWAHVGHLQILWSWWMPLALQGLHQWVTHARRWGLLLFGAAWLGQSLSNGYYFFYFSIIVVLWLAWFIRWRQAKQLLVPVLFIWGAAVACLAPILLTYSRVHQEYQLARSAEEIGAQSADLTDFFRVSSVPRFPDLDRWEREEGLVSLGLVGTFALVAGVASSFGYGLRRAWRERSSFAFYLTATFVAILLALGPSPRIFGVEIWHNGPYFWLMTIIPGLMGLRVPSRFALLAILSLAITGALLLTRIHFANATRERLVFGALLLIILIETWPRPLELRQLPTVVDPRILTPNAAVLELPLGGNQEPLALYRSMFHRRPLVNGYSGYSPASYDALRTCLDHQGISCLTSVRSSVGALDVLVDRESDRFGEWVLAVSQLPDAQVRFKNRQFAIFHFPVLTGTRHGMSTTDSVEFKSAEASRHER